MNIKTIEGLVQKGLAAPRKRLALCGAADEASLAAVFAARRAGVIAPLLFGDAREIRALCRELGEDIDGTDIFDCRDAEEAAAAAVAAVREGEAHILMKGMLQTAEIMRAVIDKEKGLLPDEGVISLCSIYMIRKYHKLLAFTDAGIIREPNLEQKKAIIQNAVGLFRLMGHEKPKVGILCAIETVNPKMQETVDAAALAEMNSKGEIKDCVIAGPISMDIALDAQVAEHKGYHSEVAGDPDILVLPNVAAGNLLIKGIGLLADVEDGLSLTLGAKVPLVVSSRGLGADKKYRAILAAVACA
jgi:phosphate butyryltransferase